MNDALRLKSALSFYGVVLGVTFDLETTDFDFEKVLYLCIYTAPIIDCKIAITVWG